MGLISGRLVIVVIVLFLGLGAAIANGLVQYKTDGYSCYQNKWWYATGDKQRLVSLGKLTLFYQPYTYDCQPDFRYDSSVYKIQNGVLVPKQATTLGL